MTPPTPADILRALRRAERNALRDVQDAARAWGALDPSTAHRQSTLDRIRARIDDLSAAR